MLSRRSQCDNWTASSRVVTARWRQQVYHPSTRIVFCSRHKESINPQLRSLSYVPVTGNLLAILDLTSATHLQNKKGAGNGVRSPHSGGRRGCARVEEMHGFLLPHTQILRTGSLAALPHALRRKLSNKEKGCTGRLHADAAWKAMLTQRWKQGRARRTQLRNGHAPSDPIGWHSDVGWLHKPKQGATS